MRALVCVLLLLATARAHADLSDIEDDPYYDMRSKERPPKPPTQVQFHGGAVGLLATPLGNEHGGKFGGGGGFLIGFRWIRLPMSLGFDFLPAGWGSTSKKFSLPHSDPATRLSLERHSSTINIDLWLRAQPAEWRFAPYVEGSAGVRFLRATYELSYVHGSGESTTEKDAGSELTYGAGAGLDFRLAKDDRPENRGSVHVTFGFRWVHGATKAFHSAAPGQQDANVDVRIPMTTTMIMLGLIFRGDMESGPDEDSEDD